MDKDNPYIDKEIPYFVYQATSARYERTIKRLIIAWCLTVVILFACVVLLYKNNQNWLREWAQYDYSDVTVDGQDGGNAAYMGDGASGVINNGESGSTEKDTQE